MGYVLGGGASFRGSNNNSVMEFGDSVDEFADLEGVIEEGEDDEEVEEEDDEEEGGEDDDEEEEEDEDEDEEEDDEFDGDKVMKKIILEYRNRRLHSLGQGDQSGHVRGDDNV